MFNRFWKGFPLSRIRFLCLISSKQINSDALGPEDDQYCFHEFNEYLNSLNPQKQLLKEVEDGAGANILPRHPIIHVKDEGGSKRHYNRKQCNTHMNLSDLNFLSNY